VLTVDVEQLHLEPGSRVLDIGCGGGRHVKATRCVPGVASIALDLGVDEVRGTKQALEELEDLDPALGGAVPSAGPWVVGRASVYELPLASQSIDCVIISEVLEHLHHEQQALEEISRVLKPGGILAVSVPRTCPEAVCWALSREYRTTPGGHVRIYRRRALLELLERSGYRVTNSHFAHALHAPFWWLKCLVGLSNDDAWVIRAYHRLLVWDLMRRPLLTRALDALLNPFIGKSMVFYAIKEGAV
jgi:ubiquinone/menaquinone biosynthesis C-methylase UbiE